VNSSLGVKFLKDLAWEKENALEEFGVEVIALKNPNCFDSTIHLFGLENPNLGFFHHSWDKSWVHFDALLARGIQEKCFYMFVRYVYCREWMLPF